LNVSEYTDKIDIISYSNKAKRIVGQIKDLCAIISGLLVSGDYKTGAQLFAKHNVRDNEDIFQRIFEVGRR
jgi:transcriptional regulator of aromatic amino acid metabolism